MTVDRLWGFEPSQVAEAEYTLECAALRPHCREEIEVVNVARLPRTRVNFTSTLPRRGHVVACPKCNTIISADLGWAAPSLAEAFLTTPLGGGQTSPVSDEKRASNVTISPLGDV